MVLKYSRFIMCFASTFAASSTALLGGCGDGVFTKVRMDAAGTGEDAAITRKDAAVTHDATMAFDTQPLNDAGLPFAEGEVTSLGGCVSLPRITVCVPPGAIDPKTLGRRAKISLHQLRGEEFDAVKETNSPGVYVFSVDVTGKQYRMGNEYFPCVTFDYDRDTTNVVPSQYFERQGSKGWEPMLQFSCRDSKNGIVGAIAEPNERVASGVIITAAKSCMSGTDCKTNYCSAKVCQ